MSVERSPWVELRFVNVGYQAVSTDLGKVDGADVVRGRPVRTFPTSQSQPATPAELDVVDRGRRGDLAGLSVLQPDETFSCVA